MIEQEPSVKPKGVGRLRSRWQGWNSIQRASVAGGLGLVIAGLVVGVILGTGSSSSNVPLKCFGKLCSGGYVPANNAQGAVLSPISSSSTACQLAEALYLAGPGSDVTALMAVRTTDNGLNDALWKYGDRMLIDIGNSSEVVPLIQTYCPAFGQPSAVQPTPADTSSPSPTTPAPSSTAGQAPPAASGTDARVLATGSGGTVYGLGGPSMLRDASGNLEVYPQLNTPVTVGSTVTIVCALYGQTVSPGAGLPVTSLWDYTSAGWFSDSGLRSVATNPTINGCTGNISSPTASNALPSATFGPFPIYNGGGATAITTSPASVSNSAYTLNDGDLVTLVCTTPGDDVSAPSFLNGQPIGHSTQWDKVSSPAVGWVPDALVNSSSTSSAAPAC